MEFSRQLPMQAVGHLLNTAVPVEGIHKNTWITLKYNNFNTVFTFELRMNMKLMAFALIALLGFMVSITEQQRFPYQMQSRVIPPWAILDAFSDADLYSYILHRKFGFPINPSMRFAQSNAYFVTMN